MKIAKYYQNPLFEQLKTMSKRGKRKAGCIAKLQLGNVYFPVIRSRAHTLSPQNLQLMQDTFLINKNVLWERTSNC